MNNQFISLATAAALLSLGFAACNKVDVQNPDVNPSGMTKAYAKVAISMPKTTSSRSGVTFNDGGIDPGVASESLVKDIQLAIYDEYGTYIGVGTLVSEMDFEGADEPQLDKDNVSDTYTKTFELNMAEGANAPAQIVAFINMDASTKNLDELLANGKVTEDAYSTEEKGFIMTNSGYYNDKDEYVVAVDIPEDAIYHDEKKPSDKVVEIYVERLAAKVIVDVDKKVDETANYVVYDANGDQVQLKYTPKYWGATGTAKKENLVKTAFDKSEDTTPSWMNDASKFRSYWANGVNWGLESWEDYYVTENEDEAPLNYLTFGDMKGVGESGSGKEPESMIGIGVPNYVLEHTSPLGIEQMNLITNTYVIVTGTYTVMKDEEAHTDFTADGEGNVDFYLLLNGEENGKKKYTVYNKSQLIAYLLKRNDVEAIYSDADAEQKINADEYDKKLDLKYNFDLNQYVLAAKEGITVYTGKNEEFDAETMKKSTNSRHYCFPEGGAYFNVPIAQNTTETVTTYGVVRNHSYVLTINKIENLGAPLDPNEFITDPDDPDPDPTPVIPDPNDFQDNFIKAEINVLSWHVVNNGVTL